LAAVDTIETHPSSASEAWRGGDETSGIPSSWKAQRLSANEPPRHYGRGGRRDDAEPSRLLRELVSPTPWPDQRSEHALRGAEAVQGARDHVPVAVADLEGGPQGGPLMWPTFATLGLVHAGAVNE
jgi:hypothetical protein